MAEEKAPLVLQEEWVKQIKEIFDDNRSLANVDKIPRVATPLLDAKPEAYIPHLVSMGTYHHWTVANSYDFRQLKMSTLEAYKVQSAATFLGNRRKTLDGVVKRINDMQQKIEDFYDWKISRVGEYPEHFALMIAIDSCFLLDFLFRRSGPSGDGMKRLEVPILCWKIQFRCLFWEMYLTSQWELQEIQRASMNCCRRRTRSCLLLIEIAETQINDPPHLLGCFRAVVLPLVNMTVVRLENLAKRSGFQKAEHEFEEVVGPVFKTGNRLKLTLSQRVKYFLELVVSSVFRILLVKYPNRKDRYGILNSYNAEELIKGGIEFKSFGQQSEQIRFDKCSGTLYLPQITVSKVQTEVFFRNMLAFEFSDVSFGDLVTQNIGDTVKRNAGGDSVTRYVGLMDCLIDTAEDVRLLRESQAILRGSGMMSDESIDEMWNGLCHPIFKGHFEFSQDLYNALYSALDEVLIRKYYMSIVKKVVWEFY